MRKQIFLILWAVGLLPISVQPSDISAGGRGALLMITGTNPAAGAEISETVPAGVRWRILSFNFQLVNDGTAANRRARIQIDDGTASIYYHVGANFTQAASSTQDYPLTPAGILGQTDASFTHIPLPINFVIPAGHRIQTSTPSLQAGDDYGAPLILVEQWSD